MLLLVAQEARFEIRCESSSWKIFQGGFNVHQSLPPFFALKVCVLGFC